MSRRGSTAAVASRQWVLCALEEFGLTPLELASLLGVNGSTVYRWRASTDEDLHMEPMQLQLLMAMAQIGNRKAFGQELCKALVLHGPLFALRTLLNEVYRD